MPWVNNDGELVHTHPNMYLQGTFSDNGSYSFRFFKNNTYQFGYTITIKLNDTVIGTFGPGDLDGRTYTSELITGTIVADKVRCSMHCTMESCNIGGHNPEGYETFVWNKPVDPNQYIDIFTGGEWHKAQAYVYTGGEWKLTDPFIYSGGDWKGLNNPS